MELVNYKDIQGYKNSYIIR